MPALRWLARGAFAIAALCASTLAASPAAAGGGGGGGAAAELHVCCGCGSDASAAPQLRASPLNSLAEAVARARLRDAAAPLTVFVAGRCAPPRRALAAADGGADEATRVTYRSYAGEAPAVVSGGVPLRASALAPVSDPAVAAQIAPAALPFVRQVNLSAALGVTDLGAPQCHAYMGGEASILPGNLVSAALELMLLGDDTLGGDLSPLTLARWPNRDRLPKQWANGSVDGYTISVDCETAARLPAWARQLREDPGSAFVHYLGGYGWNDHHNQLAAVVPPPTGYNCSSAPPPGALNCSDFESGFDYDGNDLQPPVPADSQAACCALCGGTSGCRAYSYCTNGDCGATNCYLKSSSAGRKSWPNRLSGPASGTLPPQKLANVTLAPCPSKYAQPGFDSLDNGGTFYAYNILAELDSEGEYYVNRTSGMLYVWPPAAEGSAYWHMSPWGKPVVPSMTAPRAIERLRAQQLRAAATAAAAAAAAAADGTDADEPLGEVSVDSDLFVLNGTSFLTLDGLVLTTARNTAVRATNTTAVTISNCIVQNTGSMAVNASGGAGLAIVGSAVRHAGNGAVFFYAGDRQTLTPAGHEIRNSSVSYSNRYMYCYVPSVALADCGNAIVDSEMFGGPHQGIFMSGNDHRVVGSLLHDLVEAASDSGVLYTGRDWSYQGSLIANNTFLRINTADPGDDVSAVYLDDMVSGFVITGNTFVNVSRALLLGGGRSNVFAGNIINGVDGADAAVHFDDRGLGWDAGACDAPTSEMVGFLARVPYNTSAVWLARFPQLAVILDDEPCVPKYNAVVDNTFCNLGAAPFLDMANATIAKYNSTAFGNVEQCSE